jgi:hypothetical protein
MWPDSFSNLCGPKLPSVDKLEVSSACQEAACVPLFIFQSMKWKRVSLKFTFFCELVGKYRNEKYMWSLSLELVKVGGLDFPQPCDGLRNSGLFFMLSLSTITVSQRNTAYLKYKQPETVLPGHSRSTIPRYWKPCGFQNSFDCFPVCLTQAVGPYSYT